MRARRCEQRCHRRARSCNRGNQVSGPSILASRLSRVPGTAVLPPFAPVRSHHAPTTSGGARNRCNCEKTPRQLIPAPFGAHPSARLLPAPPPLPSALPYARGIHFTSVRPLTFPPRPGGPRTVATVRKPWLLIPVPFGPTHPLASFLPLLLLIRPLQRPEFLIPVLPALFFTRSAHFRCQDRVRLTTIGWFVADKNFGVRCVAPLIYMNCLNT